MSRFPSAAFTYVVRVQKTNFSSALLSTPRTMIAITLVLFLKCIKVGLMSC